VDPHREDMNNLSNILVLFGEVIGLETNLQKSMHGGTHIRCEQIDIEDVFEGMPTIRGSFPMKYLGLPLSIWQLKRVDFQPFNDKMGSKLVTWDGKNINIIGRGILVKSRSLSHRVASPT
jgi:hypothetical protein